MIAKRLVPSGMIHLAMTTTTMMNALRNVNACNMGIGKSARIVVCGRTFSSPPGISLFDNVGSQVSAWLDSAFKALRRQPPP